MSGEEASRAALKKKMRTIEEQLSSHGFMRREVAGIKDSAVFTVRIDDLPFQISIWITASYELELINIALVSSYHIRRKFIPEIIMKIHSRMQKDCMGSLVVDTSSGQVCWRFDLPWRISTFPASAVAGVVLFMVRLGIDILVDFVDELSSDLNPEEAVSLPPAHVVKRS